MSINNCESAMQTYVVAHEIGHRVSEERVSENGYREIDKSDEWLKISGFESIDNGKFL